MKSLGNFIVVLSGLLIVSCATTMRATTDFDASVDFSAYETFSWIDSNPLISSVTQRPLSPLVVGRLKAETRELLSASGLRFVEDPTEADLAVAFTIGSREGIRITSYPTRNFRTGPRGRRDYRWNNYWSGNQIRTRQYTEGQLAVDLFDVTEARPVWHGTTATRITRGDRESPDELIRQALEAIFAKFPPQ
ncbi:MAG: DUF4136 domain-containing protein [Gammaproteobacteria bacterium]